MERRWDTHELRVLRAIEEREPVPSSTEVVAALAGQLEKQEVQETLHRLLDADYIAGVDATAMSGGVELLEVRLREKARVKLGQWPGDELAEVFLELLRDRADTTSDKGEKRRLDTAVSSLASIGGQTLSGILAQLVMRGGM